MKNSNFVVRTSNDGMQAMICKPGKEPGYVDGFNDGVKSGKAEIANRLSIQLKQLLELGHTVVDINTVISMVEAHKSL